MGWDGILGMPRGDGLTDGFDTIQGVRTYDGAIGSWTTPDAFSGTVEDPMSQKGYIWNRNDPATYSDPSGYSPLVWIDPLLWLWETRLPTSPYDHGDSYYLENTVVLFSTQDPEYDKSAGTYLGVHENEVTLDLPPMRGWNENSYMSRNMFELSYAMSFRKPIRDSWVNPNGSLRTGGKFLEAERGLLEQHGWTYDPKTTFWSPPQIQMDIVGFENGSESGGEEDDSSGGTIFLGGYDNEHPL